MRGSITLLLIAKFSIDSLIMMRLLIAMHVSVRLHWHPCVLDIAQMHSSGLGLGLGLGSGSGSASASESESGSTSGSGCFGAGGGASAGGDQLPEPEPRSFHLVSGACRPRRCRRAGDEGGQGRQGC